MGKSEWQREPMVSLDYYPVNNHGRSNSRTGYIGTVKKRSFLTKQASLKLKTFWFFTVNYGVTAGKLNLIFLSFNQTHVGNLQFSKVIKAPRLLAKRHLVDRHLVDTVLNQLFTKWPMLIRHCVIKMSVGQMPIGQMSIGQIIKRLFPE